MIDLVDGLLQPLDEQADSQADYQRLRSAPSPAQAAYESNRHSVSGPCVGLDVTSRRCRHYEFRPDICRTFETGGKWCQGYRERLIISPQFGEQPGEIRPTPDL
jgi:Fe-S-cluster containining protein